MREIQTREKSPLKIFLESGLLTEDFFELYCHGFAVYLVKSERVKVGDDIAIGWDPRDLTGDFTSRAVIGVRKAGLNARVLGMVPTPAVPLHMCEKDLQAGIAITASHNPADQNGIKLFLTPKGLKPLPKEEEEISHFILSVDPEKLKTLAPTGNEIDCREGASRLLKAFHADPLNSWDKTGRAFREVRLVVDASNGACSGIAAEVFRMAGFKEVTEINVNPEDGINNECGVVGLENISVVQSTDSSRKSKFFGTIFREGKNHREAVADGKEFIMGVVFDGDGDRFFLTLYDPKKNEIQVLSGDEIAFHQAKYLMANEVGQEETLYVNTVESDLQCSIEAVKLGFTVEKTGVGDKWLLTKAAEAGGRFAIGSERSGHIITEGYLTNSKNEKACVFAGNGIKGALNVVASIYSLYIETDGEDWMSQAARPFHSGFNKITYIYYTDKQKWRRGSKIWTETRQQVEDLVKTAFGEEARIKEKDFSEEPDLLFFEIFSGENALRASIHIRNSGTEDKTGITMKGSMEDNNLLNGLAEPLFKSLAGRLKNPDHPFCIAQKKIIRLLYPDRVISRNDLPEDILSDGSLDRLLKETEKKEKMIRETESGYQLTELGTWYYTHHE